MSPEYLQNSNGRFKLEELPAGLPYRLLMLSGLVFVTLFIVYAGLSFGYAGFLRSQITSVRAEVSALGDQVGEAEQRSFAEFYSQLVHTRELMDRHTTSRPLFAALERFTRRDVSYTGFTLALNERTATIEGVARSYELLASQLAVFEQASSYFERVVLESSRLSPQGVAFQLRLTLTPALFAFSAPVPAPVPDPNSDTLP